MFNGAFGVPVGNSHIAPLEKTTHLKIAFSRDVLFPRRIFSFPSFAAKVAVFHRTIRLIQKT